MATTEPVKSLVLFPVFSGVATVDIRAAFFITLCGGPPMYQQLYGPPMMRRRHIPFRIDESARQEWLRCFQNVLENAVEDYDFPAEHMDGFKLFLEGFSGWMINTK